MQHKPKKVLILGSGGLKIGQAGEFDYSGSQALKALREEGISTVLVNPNIATVQTNEGMADATYFLPVTPHFVEEVIKKENPDGLLLSFGGQTALNCGVELERSGVLARYNVAVLGTPVRAIEETEDRELFAKKLQAINVVTARSEAVTSTADAKKSALRIGYPVMVRAAYALGGSGSGLCSDEAQLIERCDRAFSISPQVLIEEWLGGWKEIEYEVVRDAFDNCITVCNMENFDPLGIHTGESIVVAPSQTLTDSEYQKLRNIAIAVVRSLGIVGECNIQYALDPHSEEYRVIEVNARLSRSSALASKATGYPLAFVAAKLALGKSLTEIENKITQKTKSCFEPALDYCVVKIPRWDLTKFKNVDTRIGSEMKSVGEIMSIGRSFEEALQKGLRMLGIGVPGLASSEKILGNVEGGLEQALKEPTDRRIFVLYKALKEGMNIERAYELTKIDHFFLEKILNCVSCEKELQEAGERGINAELLGRAKKFGFSDARIAELVGLTELSIRAKRESWNIKPVFKIIDSLAAEFPALTNYLYATYHGVHTDIAPINGGVGIVGSGSYRIGSSVEFDWCCVRAVETVRAIGQKAIMINCNPETVSTDFDVCDRLYFEELSYERIMDIYQFENPSGLILSMGGQIPNNLALPLSASGVKIFGTSAHDIDRAEDRHKFSSLLESLNIEQPDWSELTSIDDAKKFAAEVGYPVLVRPSYVLSGAAMNVAWDEDSLMRALSTAADLNSIHPVVMSKFVTHAKEVEIDAVAHDGEIIFHAITEHIENAGIHSGDATIVLPPQRLYIETIRKIKTVAVEIARSLKITGPFNIQFLAKNNKISVIECNLRASRSFPFCTKVARTDMIGLAVRAMLGTSYTAPTNSALDLNYVGVKAAQFSFSRLRGADPVLGVEMASTGEVGCLGTSLDDAFYKAFLSVGYKKPRKKILISTGPIEDKIDFIESARSLVNMGYQIYASEGTAKFLAEQNIKAESLYWPLEKTEPNIESALRSGSFDLVINIPKNSARTELKNGFLIRRLAIDLAIPLITDIKIARQFVEALEHAHTKGTEIKAHHEYR